MKAKALKLVISMALSLPIILLAGIISSAGAIEGPQAGAFLGRDVHISGDKLLSYQGQNGENSLVIEGNCSISAGADTFTGQSAVIWLRQKPEPGAGVSISAYVTGKVSARRNKGIRLPGLNWQMVEAENAIVVWFVATGEVFVTADSREAADVRESDFYSKAFSSVSALSEDFSAQFQSLAPVRLEPRVEPQPPRAVEPKREAIEPTTEQPGRRESGEGIFGFIDRLFGRKKKAQASAEPGQPKVTVRYPVNLAPATDQEPNVEWGGTLEGADITTIIGRFYLWQKQDQRGGLLEMQADAAVVFYSSQKLSDEGQQGGIQDIAAKGAIQAVYLQGDVVMTEGLRTIRADQMYYNFVAKRGLAVNAEMRSFDPGRGIPIYIRAAKLRQLAENKFAAENVVVTTSEFYVPQVSVEASSVLVTDTTALDQQQGQIKDNSYDLEMRDVRLKAGKSTVFYWPFMRSDLERPDVPFKSLSVSHDSIWGTTVESRWYLSRLLGLQEPEGTDGTFELDYYSKRGLGTGIDVDYATEDRFGSIVGYIIDDRGEDRLGRIRSRRNLEPPEQLRGRFGWVHREFMPYNWEVTMGINYESDENFVESYYRREYNTGPDRETYVHLKRIEDNWGMSILGKGRLNDFADEMEEFPSAEYHLTGQSLLDDKLTLYSDSEGGMYRQRIGDYHATAMTEEHFTFAWHRSELDMPVWAGEIKTVPYVAGTVGFDDRSGFNRSLVDGSNAGMANEDTVVIGEAGLRASSEYWKVYRGVKSRLWDLDGLRHTIRPELAAAVFAESDIIVKQHDMIYLGLSQRLQTKRGPDNDKSTIDWMRLNVGATWVGDSEKQKDGFGPDRFIWNRPMTPLRIYTMPGILNGDLAAGLKKFEVYGPRRNYFSADYAWQITDTTAFVSDGYFDMQSGTVDQLDVGFSRTRWPDLSYYIGSRYLRNVKVLNEKGSNAFVFAASYVLDPRYTLVLSQQLDFDYGANVESNITLIRRYHRVFWSLTFSADESLDRQAIVFSIWPQGIPELALGSRRYTGMTGPGGY